MNMMKGFQPKEPLLKICSATPCFAIDKRIMRHAVWPAGLNVQGYVQMVKQGKQEALKLS
jgi:hypothetical protein